MIASKFSWNHFISEKHKTVQCFKLHFLQNVPLCNYTLLPVTVKLLETSLEAILWKTFQLLHCILNDVSSITNILALSLLILVEGSGKNTAAARSGEYGGCSSFITLFFDKKSLTKTDWCAGALLWSVHQMLILNFSGHFLLTTSLRKQRVLVYIYLFTVAILVNYTYAFWELLETMTYIMIGFSLLYGEQMGKGLIGGSYSIYERHESCVCSFNWETWA